MLGQEKVYKSSVAHGNSYAYATFDIKTIKLTAFLTAEEFFAFNRNFYGLKCFAQSRQVNYTSTVMEPSIPSLTPVERVDAEDNTIEKIRNLGLPLEFDIVTSKLNSQVLSTENFDQISEIMFTQKTDPTNKKEHQFRKYAVLNCFRKQYKDKERKRNSCSRLTSPANCFLQNFRAYQNQIHANKQISSYPVVYSSRKAMIQ